MNYYTIQKNTLILIDLLKKHGISKVVASPGTTNIGFVASIQQDPYFEIYSSVDERSAAYIACGLAAETGEPVVISCTGATASRNYMSGLTEAFYRKLPILAVTSSQDIARIGQNAPQLIDRRVLPNDIAKMSIHVPNITTDIQVRDYTVLMNAAILELTHQGGGPVHINLTHSYSRDFSVQTLPEADAIYRIGNRDALPELPKGRIVIFVGSHQKWNKALVDSVEAFCRAYDAAVLVDHISNYTGKYSVFSNLLTYQDRYDSPCSKFELMIHIGEIVGTDFQGLTFNQVWRVNEDGAVKSTFGKLKYVFEMPEEEFFAKYAAKAGNVPEKKDSYVSQWRQDYQRVLAKMPELPFSNIWIAQHTIDKLPDHSVIHFAVQNSLRTWNFFEGNKTLRGYCNTGGFGIDGNMSSLVGASLADENTLYFGVVGDLAFFYDMNVLGNRHIKNNIRIIMVNNGGGQQFRNHDSAGRQFDEKVNDFIAAKGHYGDQSKGLVRDYATNLGFEYMAASTKEEYLKNLPRFVTAGRLDKPVLFEVFMTEEDERNSMEMLMGIEETNKQKAIRMVSNVIGTDNTKKIIRVLKNR